MFCVGCAWEILNADDLVILAEMFENHMTKIKWSRVKGTKGELNVEISILSKLLVNILVQCAGKVSERTQFSAVDVHFVR